MVKSRLTYANVMATIAVFLALGGVATAALTLPKKSVGPKQLKAGAVKTGKIADGAVTDAKLAEGAVTEPKIANEAVTAAKVKNNTLTGDKIAGGQVVKDIVLREVVDDNVGNNAFSIQRPSCASGETAIAGGGGFTGLGTRNYSNNDIETDLRTFAPLAANDTAATSGTSATKWLVSAQNLSGAARDFHAYVVCAKK
jgi:hypothetical protein